MASALPATAMNSRQRIDRYFEVSLYLLLVAGFSLLITTGQLDTPSVLCVSVALVLRGYLIAKERTWNIPESWTTRFTIAYVLFYAFDYFALSKTFVTASVHLLLFSMVVKIFSVRRDRDYVYLGVLAFLEVLAGSVLTVDTLFLISFLVFVILAATTFVALEMKRAAARAQTQAREIEVAGRLPTRLTAMVFTLVAAILLGASILFVVLPRMSGGYMSALAQRDQLQSGFSDSVQLGQIGQIQLMNTVVMHVQSLGGPPHPSDLAGLYWRGIALGIFDGRSWSNPKHDMALLAADRYGGGDFPIAKLYPPWETAPGTAHVLHYRVLLEPIDTGLFFLTPRAMELRGNYAEIGVDDGGSVYDNDRERPITRYEAISIVPQRDLKRLRAAQDQGRIPPKVALRYLQLPSLDPRIPELSQQIAVAAQTPFDKAAAIESYLSSHYGYTLNQGSSIPRDPLAEFLFKRKQGHCEYFASSMAVMLRVVGIPSRVVNGFRGGEFNPLTGNYILRARDAHSWVEAFFPGSGWVTFDPTPASAIPPPDASQMALYLDAMREFWRDWIINYDFLHQRTLGATAIHHTRHGVDHLRDWTRMRYEHLLAKARGAVRQLRTHPGTWAVLAILGMILLFFAANVGTIRRLLRAQWALRHPEHAPQATASIWYLRMTRTLARRGWPKQPAQTPSEFAATIEDNILRGKVERFTQQYERARFGESAEDAQQLPAAYEEIRSK